MVQTRFSFVSIDPEKEKNLDAKLRELYYVVKSRFKVTVAAVVIIVCILGVGLSLFVPLNQQLQQPSGAWLSIDGTQVKLNGETYPFRSVQIDQNVANGGHGSQWWTEQDVQRIKSHGANLIETSGIRYDVYMPSPSTINEAEIAKTMDVWASWASANRLYCLFTFGCIAGSQWFPPQSWMIGTKTQDQFEIDFFANNGESTERQAVINLWKFIANRYKNNPYVLLNFFNEPYFGNELLTYSNADALSQNYINFVRTLVDAVRSTGATNLIVVDHPCGYYYGSGRYDVEREVVYEGHCYVTESYNLTEWKSDIDNFVNRYVTGFQRPLFIGEYGYLEVGTIPATGEKIYHVITHNFPNWQNILTEEVAYLKSKPLCGYSWHAYSFLHGEWYDYYYTSLGIDCFTASESEWILTTVLQR